MLIRDVVVSIDTSLGKAILNQRLAQMNFKLVHDAFRHYLHWLLLDCPMESFLQTSVHTTMKFQDIFLHLKGIVFVQSKQFCNNYKFFFSKNMNKPAPRRIKIGIINQ